MSKRLTDEQCAAEYWRAEAAEKDAIRLCEAGYYPANSYKWRESLDRETWHRFAIYPHAFEETA